MTEKHIDWEEVKKYQREHPLYKKLKPEKKRKRHYRKRISTLVDKSAKM